MDRPPLKVLISSDISAAFGAVLAEVDVSFIIKVRSCTVCQDNHDQILNFAGDYHEIAVAVIEPLTFWDKVASTLAAFTREHKHKAVYVEKYGYKFKASGMSQAELSKALQDATMLIIKES